MVITKRLEQIDKEIELIFSLPISDLVSGIYETRISALEEEKKILRRIISPSVDRACSASFFGITAKKNTLDYVIESVINEANRN
jgi:hypothetical protein